MTRTIVWAVLALVIGGFAGYYFGFGHGYDEAAGMFNLAASLK